MDPAADILRAVKAAVGPSPVALQRPPVVDADFEGIASALNSGGSGAVLSFEARLAAAMRVKFAISMSTGTAALHAALVAAGVKPGDEVLCPSLTFVATANAILLAGAVPHLVDVNQASFGVHPFKLRQYLALGVDDKRFVYDQDGLYNVTTGRPISAFVPVHLLGMPCQIDELGLTAAHYGLTIIEDAAEALGIKLNGTVVVSFNLNKIITTGGGGAVMTNDEALAKRVRHLSAQAKVEHPFLWQHDAAGWNYRMSPLCAALGSAQLKKLPRILEEKAKLSERYGYYFKDIQTAELRHGGNNWLNCALLDPRCMRERDKVIQTLLDNGYESRAMFTPLHMLPHLKGYPRQQSLETSEDIWRRAICLPSSIQLER